MSAENGHNAESRRTERRDLLLAGLVALGLIAMFVAVQRGKVSTYDSKIALATARAIADGHLHLTPADDHAGRNLPYSHYGIGMPLMILPLYLLQRALRLSPEMLTTLASPLLLAASGALLYLCGRELGWSRRVSLAAGLVFGALTQALQISQDLFSEPGVACGTALLMVGMLRWRAGRPSGPWLAGSGLGVGLLFRSDSAILLGVGLLLLPAVVPWRRLLAERRAWLGLVVPMLPVLAWTAWYSLRRDGTLVPAVYGGSFTTPLLEGLHGLLLSHGRSLLVYNPFLLLAVPGAIALWRRDRAATALLVVLVVVRPLFYARWNAWGGGVNWGPRFLMPSVGPLSLLATYAASRVGRLRAGLRVPAALVVAGLVVVGGVVSVASVWVWAGASWKWREYRPPGLEGQALREFSAERRNGYIYRFSSSAIAFNLRHLAHDNPDFPLNHFRGGADPIGLIGVAVALLVPLASWVLGRPPRGPPSQTNQPPTLGLQASSRGRQPTATR
jgi:hypothetical protein